MKMKQSSSTAQNMLIEKVKVRGEVVFRSDALESENKGVQAFAIVIFPCLFLSGVCSVQVLSLELSCWIFPEAPVYTAACAGWSFYMQSASSPPACPHGGERMMDVSGE